MVALIIVIGFLTLAFVVALIAAEIVDRRRSLEIVADASRFPPRTVAPQPRYP